MLGTYLSLINLLKTPNPLGIQVNYQISVHSTSVKIASQKSIFVNSEVTHPISFRDFLKAPHTCERKNIASEA